jgi:hypothetical protein
MTMSLSGGTANPTSVLPLPFSSYSSGELQISAIDLGERVYYEMDLSSLNQISALPEPTSYVGPQLLTFNGTLTNYQVTAVAVPGPIIGAGLPGLITACGGLLVWWHRKCRTQAVG